MSSFISDNFASVKNVIFDLGNVILDIDTRASMVAFSKRGIDSFEKIPKEIFHDFETGNISSAVFRKSIRRIFPNVKSLSDTNFDHAWNAMLGNFSSDRLNILLKLKSSYRTFLLSNTNEIHVDHFSQSAQKISGHTLDNYFEKVYYSNQIKMRKPSPEIYAFVLEENKLVPDETLFIDDLQENLNSAQSLGIQVLLMEKRRLTLEDMFPELI